MKYVKLKIFFWWLMVFIVGLANATVWGLYAYFSKEFAFNLEWTKDLIYSCILPSIILFILLFLVLNEITKLNQGTKTVTIKTTKIRRVRI